VLHVDVVAMIADERRRIADLIDSLDPRQLGKPSLCAEWTIKQVAAHLYATAAESPRLFVWALLRSGFNPHKANVKVSKLLAARPAAELAAGLREHADNPFSPPIVGHLGQVTDVQVHGQDMRRPLGLPHDLQPDRVRLSLDFLVSGRAPGFVPKRRPAGLRFEATDVNWAWGAGPVVQGTGEAVMLALTGRTVVLDELCGDGVAVLRDRL
jgi:uncharacterized protein (TIGR03083 family)